MAMLITNTGQAIIAQLLISGEALNLKYMAVGDGDGSPVTPSEIQTALVREVYRGQITNYTIATDDGKTVSMNFTIPADVGGWTIRECGVFDSAGNLIAVGSVTPTYKPSSAEEQSVNLTLRCVLTVSSQLNITLSTDPYFKAIQSEIISVTTEIFEVHNNDPDAHPNLSGIPTGGKDGDIIMKYGNENRVIKWKAFSDLMKDENDNFYFG